MQRTGVFDAVIAPVLLFVSFYVATLLVLTFVALLPAQWSGLVSAVVATSLTVLIWEKGKWNLGFFVRPRLAVPEFLFGSLWGTLLVGACALLVIASTGVHHDRGGGFPWLELAAVFVPAAVHEELLFRGYVYQKLRRHNRTVAILALALLFAGLHFNNNAVSRIGLTNIVLGGILLALAYELYRRLWFPIGLHLAWNVMSGPVLGHEVSGYESARTLLVERGTGQLILTGGDFGIEGSLWMTVVELAGIAGLEWMRRRRLPPQVNGKG